MSSTRRRLSRSCKYKIRYENETAATIAVRVEVASGVPWLCGVCEYWHVGGGSVERKKAMKKEMKREGAIRGGSDE